MATHVSGPNNRNKMLDRRNADVGVDALEEEIRQLEELAAGGSINQSTPPNDEPEEVHEQETATSREEQTFKKRYGDLRRHAQRKEDEYKTKIAELERKVNTKEEEFPTDPEKVKEWITKFPEVAAIVMAIADERANNKSNEIKSRIEQIESQAKQLTKKEATLRIKEAHKDFDQIKDSDAFHDWLETQPERIQDLIYDGDADQVIWGINLYKTLTQKGDPAAAARAISTKSNKAQPSEDSGERRFSESQVQAMSIREYEDHEEAINKAIRAGRFDYDISGAAR